MSVEPSFAFILSLLSEQNLAAVADTLSSQSRDNDYYLDLCLIGFHYVF